MLDIETIHSLFRGLCSLDIIWNKDIITIHEWHDNEENRKIKDNWGDKCSSEKLTMKLQIKAHHRKKATYVQETKLYQFCC